MISLGRTIIVRTTLLLAFVGLGGATLSYQLAQEEARYFLDSQLQQIALNAGEGLSPEATPKLPYDDEDKILVKIWTVDGQKLHDSDPSIPLPSPGPLGFSTVAAAEDLWRLYTSSDGRRVVQVAQRETVRNETAQNAALQAAAPIVAVVPLTWLMLGWALNRFSRRLTELAADIALRTVEHRHPIATDGVAAEVAPLVLAMNGLLERLQRSLEQQRRFVSDAAHELRTPLTALTLQIENLRRYTLRDDDAVLEELDQGCRRATRLIDQLLHMARYEAEVAAAVDVVDLEALLKKCLAREVVLANAASVDLGLTEVEPAAVFGIADELEILFNNLVENAVRYSPPGGRVDVAVRTVDGEARVEISDQGLGISEDALPKVFDRFFRAAPSGIDGNGLGLSIVKAIAERNHMRVALSNGVDGGLIVRVSARLVEAGPCGD